MPDRGLAARWAPRGAHLGFLLLLLAGLITHFGADIRDAELREGRELELPREGLTLRLEKFSVIGHEDVPEQYRSYFLVKDRKGQRRHAELFVNRPLVLGGTKIFQMRYRVDVFEADLFAARKGEPARPLRLKKGEWAEVPGAGFSVRYTAAVPDFRMDPKGTVFSPGFAFRNPALRLEIRRGDAVTSRWILQDRLPEHGAKEEWSFLISRLHKVYTSGLRLSNDPGKGIAFAGYFLLVVSVFLSSFAIRREEV